MSRSQYPSAEEVVVTLVNIAAIDRLEEEIYGLPGLLAQSVGYKIQDVDRSSDHSVLGDVTLLNDITQTCREVVGAFVLKTTNKQGQVVNVQPVLANVFGFAKKEPYMDVLRNTKYMNVDQAKLNTFFKFLALCLKRVVADNELGGLK